MNSNPKPTVASRVAKFREKLAEAPVSKLTAIAFSSGVFGSLILGVLPDLFANHITKSTATAFSRVQPGVPETAKILPGAERVISVEAASTAMAFLYLESGDSVIFASRDEVTKKIKPSRGISTGGSLRDTLPAAIVSITPQSPLRIYNGGNNMAEVYISVSDTND